MSVRPGTTQEDRFHCYRILRARHATLVSLECALDLPLSGPAREERVAQREEAENVRRAVDALPDSQRDVVRLFYFEELSQREIAHWLDMPLTTSTTGSMPDGRSSKEVWITWQAAEWR